MNNNFKNLLEQYSEEWKSVVSADTLDQLEKSYTNVEFTRDKIMNLVFTTAHTPASVASE